MVSFRSPIFSLAVLCLTASLSFGQSSGKLSFQGRLTDSGGTPINNASQNITFALYKGTTKIWQETQVVSVVDGIYSVLLGSVVSVDTIRFDQPIDLGVKVGADAEMAPRIPLVATATARSLPGLYSTLGDTTYFKAYNLVSTGNIVPDGATGVVILGGLPNSYPNEATESFATVLGGAANRAYYNAAVAGGIGNKADGQESFVGGGNSNKATLVRDVVGGGLQNEATGGYSTVPGGSNNHAHGSYSFAAGYNAHALHVGSFVWSDWSKSLLMDSLYSTAANQFVVRATGGVGINRAPGNLGIHLKQQGAGNLYGIRTEYSDDTDYWDTYVDVFNDYNFAFNGVLKSYVQDSDGSYTVYSDASLKDDVQEYGSALDGILKLHPSTYRFKDAPNASPRSIGLIAQEVQRFFPELVSEKGGLLALNYSGLSVVAIKAIQDMYAELQELRSQLARQQQEIADLRLQNTR